MTTLGRKSAWLISVSLLSMAIPTTADAKPRLRDTFENRVLARFEELKTRLDQLGTENDALKKEIEALKGGQNRADLQAEQTRASVTQLQTKVAEPTPQFADSFEWAKHLASIPATPEGRATANATLPAVSGFSGRLGVAGGVIGNERGTAGLNGLIAAPVSHDIGLQVDMASAYTSQTLTGGVAAQIFHRNPDKGGLGLYTSYSFSSAFNGAYVGGAAGSLGVARAGVSGEIYFGRWTIEGLAGWEGGDIKGRAFDIIDLAYYPTDNLRVAAGHRRSGGEDYGAVSVEYQLPVNSGTGVSLFADGL